MASCGEARDVSGSTGFRVREGGQRTPVAYPTTTAVGVIGRTCVLVVLLVRRSPTPRHQLVDSRRRVCLDLDEHAADVFVWIDGVQSAGRHDRVEDRQILRMLGAASEE